MIAQSFANFKVICKLIELNRFLKLIMTLNLFMIVIIILKLVIKIKEIRFETLKKKI